MSSTEKIAKKKKAKSVPGPVPVAVAIAAPSKKKKKDADEGSSSAPPPPQKVTKSKSASKKSKAKVMSRCGISDFDFRLDDYSDIITLEHILAGVEKTSKWATNNTLSKGAELLNKVKDGMDLMKVLNKNYNTAPDDASASVTLTQPFAKLFKIADYSKYLATSGSVGNTVICGVVWTFLESLSNLAIYPGIMLQLVKYSSMSSESKGLMKNNLMFTFALRNIVAKIAFQTVISKAVYDALRAAVEKDDLLSWKAEKETKPWMDAVAFVGFNRLFSPNNMAGVSISSDIDFKLVINTDTILFDVPEPKKADAAAEKAAAEVLEKRKGVITKALNEAMAEWITAFNGARLTLEVEDFTTKDLAEVEKVLMLFEAEQNFYASMLKNNCLICGNKKLYKDFIGKVETFAETNNSFILAEKTFAQYLGDSDKGSILAIKNLGKFQKVVKACGKPLAKVLGTSAGADALRVFCKATNFENKPFFALSKAQQKEWVTSQLVFYKLTKDDSVMAALIADADVTTALAQVEDQFPSISKVKNPPTPPEKIHKNTILRIAKLLKGITDDEILTFDEAERSKYHSHNPSQSRNFWNQIGSPLAEKLTWVITIKFACCRLSDFFSSVPLDEYKKWNKTNTAEKTYNDAKIIATAINVFALSLQTAIYLVSTHRTGAAAIAASHQTIDNLYSRVTRNEFFELLTAKTLKTGGISAAVDALVISLGEIHIATQVVIEGQNLQQTIAALQVPSVGLATVVASDGKAFFDRLFELADKTAQKLYVK